MENKVSALVDMGFERGAAISALRFKHGDIQAAANYLISHPYTEETSKVEAPKGQWSCPSCTYFNDDRHPTCQICGAIKPGYVENRGIKKGSEYHFAVKMSDEYDDSSDETMSVDSTSTSTTTTTTSTYEKDETEKMTSPKMTSSSAKKSERINIKKDGDDDDDSDGESGGGGGSSGSRKLSLSPLSFFANRAKLKRAKSTVMTKEELEEKQRKLIKAFQKAHSKEFDALKKVFLSPECCTDSKAEFTSSPPKTLLKSPEIIELLKKYVPDVLSMRDRRNISCVTTFIVRSYYHGLPFYDAVPAVKTHIRNALQCIFAFANDPEKTETEKKRHLMRLADAFTSCQAEQGRVIDSIYGMISGRTKGLREQILALVDEQKMRVMDTVIVEIHPEAAQKTLISNVQFPHLESSYIHAVGEQLGMRGVAGSAVDKNITMLSPSECKDVLKRFHRLFSVFEVIQTFVDDVNQQDSGNDRLISREDLLKWAGDDSVNRGFDKFSIFYDETLDPSEYNDAKPTEENEYQPFLTRGVALDIFSRIFLSK